TLFGIFLTPVFFYVIESAGETNVFRLPAVRGLGAVPLGLGAGLVAGLLAWEGGFPRLRWALGRGAALGGLTLGLVQGRHRLKKLRPVAGRAAPRVQPSSVLPRYPGRE